MKFIIVAYYTNNSIYESASDKLAFAANKLEIPHYIYGIPSRGGWCENTEYKPYFVRECMDEFPYMNIIYTDADSVVCKYPVLFDNPDADVIIRKQDFPWRKNEFMSGTFFLRNNDACKKMVDTWIQYVEAGKTVRSKPETWEQAHLGRAIVDSGVNYAQLPHDYIYYDHMEQIEGKVDEPVFVHMQYSRKTGHLRVI